MYVRVCVGVCVRRVHNLRLNLEDVVYQAFMPEFQQQQEFSKATGDKELIKVCACVYSVCVCI